MLLIILFAVLTSLVLLTGLFSMVASPEFRKKYATKLMFLRVAMQALALLSLLLAMWQ